MPKSFALNIVCHIQNHPILIINLGKQTKCKTPLVNPLIPFFLSTHF